jgi:hypothetical protein
LFCAALVTANKLGILTLRLESTVYIIARSAYTRTVSFHVFPVSAMPQKCCAPGCSGNYDGSENYVSVFKFPQDLARRQLWLERIPRDNLQITKNTVICRRHFEDRFVLTEDRVVCNGQEIVVKRDRPKLTDDAYPSIFANIPEYLSSAVLVKRRRRRDRLIDVLN